MLFETNQGFFHNSLKGQHSVHITPTFRTKLLNSVRCLWSQKWDMHAAVTHTYSQAQVSDTGLCH